MAGSATGPARASRFRDHGPLDRHFGQDLRVPQNIAELRVGSEWAYRQHRDDPIVRVRVLRIGKERPLRAKVRFVDDEFEGREDWVPRARLKARWEGLGLWQAREERWEAVRHAAAPAYSSPEYWATDYVLSCVVDFGVETGCGRNATVLSISDPNALANLLGLTTKELAEDPLAFDDDDGSLVASWATAERVARCVAPLRAGKLLAGIERREAEARRRALHGHYYELGGGKACYRTPEDCAELDEHWQPGHDLVREWCGAEAVNRHDEIQGLRDEVLRLSEILERAIRELASAGRASIAAKISRQLGFSLDTARANRDFGHPGRRSARRTPADS
jgi:hypothetical protein